VKDRTASTSISRKGYYTIRNSHFADENFAAFWSVFYSCRSGVQRDRSKAFEMFR